MSAVQWVPIHYRDHLWGWLLVRGQRVVGRLFIDLRGRWGATLEPSAQGFRFFGTSLGATARWLERVTR